MITIGRSVKWYNNYHEEVQFSKSNNFDFMQIWFQKGNIVVDSLSKPKEKYIKEKGYPIIFHAVFDLDDFDRYGDALIKLLQFFQHNELIIHPVCEEHIIDEKTIYTLANHIKKFYAKLKPLGITLYIENNSVIDSIYYKPADLDIVFQLNPDVELLLDVAHIDSYQHLESLLKTKYPKCLHIADKHFDVKHEHLPIGQGDLDYELIFSKYLRDFDGRIILEIVDDNEVLIDSKQKIINAINFSK